MMPKAMTPKGCWYRTGAPQLKRLRIPGAPAEAFAGRLDWQQVRQAGAAD